MKSVRLSKGMREDIRDSIMREVELKWFESTAYKDQAELGEAIKSEMTIACIAAWNHVYGRYKPLLDQLPIEFKPTGTFTAWCNDLKTPLSFRDKEYPGKSQTGYDVVLTEQEYRTLAAGLIEVEKLLGDWRTEHKSTLREVMAIIDSVNTTAQLVEAWPTAEAYIPAYIADPNKGIKVPALQVSRLDEKLGVAA